MRNNNHYKIREIIEKSIKLDLDAFIKDEKYVKNISANLKDILKRDIVEKLS